LKGQLDQIDAAAQHERDRAELARVRREAASAAPAAEAEAEMALPAAIDAAMETLTAVGIDLHARITRVRELQAERERLAGDARTLGQALGEPVDPGVVVDHLERVGPAKRAMAPISPTNTPGPRLSQSLKGVSVAQRRALTSTLMSCEHLSRGAAFAGYGCILLRLRNSAARACGKCGR
jgi:hypothetical protein